METINTGLNGVPICETDISVTTSDAEGKPFLLYRGHSIYDLVNLTFEETSYLLLNGKLPNASELEAYDEELKKHREIDSKVIDVIRMMPASANRMDVLLTALSYARMFDKDYANDLWTDTKGDIEAGAQLILHTGTRMGAKIPTIIACAERVLAGKDPIAPNPEIGHAANLLHMLGLPEDPDAAKALDVTLTLYLDHTMNNSTFMSRVASSARPDPYGPMIAAGVGLKGVLHGGANEMASHMFDEIGDASNAEQFILDKFEKGAVVFGFGHRLSAYKTGVESRVIIAEGLAKSLAKTKGATRLTDIYDVLTGTMMSEKIEERKRRAPNLDLAVAVIYKILGIPTSINTPIFQASRHFGWLSHVVEQHRQKGPLYRPTQKDVFAGMDSVKPCPPLEKR